MHPARHYREQAQHARRLAELAELMRQRSVRDTLYRVARDFEQTAYDLEIGTAEIRHPEVLPQQRRNG
jgi:hypothetical protein